MATYSEGGQSKLHDLLAKAISDQEFADKVINPQTRAEALKDVGIDPTPEVMHEVGHSIQHLRQVWETFGPSTAAS